MKDSAPYEIRSRHRVFLNSKFEVFSDTLVQKDGQVVEGYLSVLPRILSPDGVTGVAVLPVMEGRIGLLWVVRHPLGLGGWEIPRGFVDEGESPGSAAVRELLEEAGIEARSDNLFSLGKIAPEASLVRGIVALFGVTKCRMGQGREASRELGHGEFRLFSREEMSDLLDGEEIRDPSTLVAVFSYLRKFPEEP